MRSSYRIRLRRIGWTLAAGHSSALLITISTILSLVFTSIRAEALCVTFVNNGNVKPACVEAVASDPQPLGNRYPLILVHGWNWKAVPGDPSPDTWTNLISNFSRDPSIRSAVKLYTFTYYSNVQSVDILAGALATATDFTLGPSPTRPILMIAHSMGGIIAREALHQPVPQRFAGGLFADRVRLLITLATPHHGSMAANKYARNDKLGPIAKLFADVFDSRVAPQWFEVNRSDLLWDNFDEMLDYSSFPGEKNDLLVELNKDTMYDDKIIAYGAAVGECSVIDPSIEQLDEMCIGSTILGNGFGLANDGFVPLSSALFYTTQDGGSRFRTRYFSDYDHRQMATGHDDNDVLFTTLKADVLAAIGLQLSASRH